MQTAAILAALALSTTAPPEITEAMAMVKPLCAGLARALEAGEIRTYNVTGTTAKGIPFTCNSTGESSNELHDRPNRPTEKTSRD